MEREVGGGIGMGNTCKPMAVSFQCMTKSTTNKKKIKKKIKTAGFSYLFLQPVCCDMLFWLKHVKKIWPPTETRLKREEYFNSFLREMWIFFDNIPKFSQNIFLKVSCDVKLETSSTRLGNSKLLCCV